MAGSFAAGDKPGPAGVDTGIKTDIHTAYCSGSKSIMILWCCTDENLAIRII
jgi:hypothetical protein